MRELFKKILGREQAKIKLKDRLGIDVDSDHEIVEDDKIREEGPNVALDVFVSG